MKIVLDTNVWVSGLLLPKGPSGQIVTAWQKEELQIVISQPILAEIKRVLSYPRIEKRIHWDEAKIDQYLMMLKFFAEFVSVDGMQIIVERDPNDSSILATLLASKADYLVTGDDDLLSLKQQYPIITPAEFLRISQMTELATI